MKRSVLFLLIPLLPLLPSATNAADGYRLYEATAASVNREVLFLTDVVREQCMRRCVAIPGNPPQDLTLEEARERLILDTLALQEQRKLELGQVDNAVLGAEVKEVAAMLESCPSPCRAEMSPEQVSEWVGRKLLVRDFLRRRVSAFVEIKDEDVRREVHRRAGKSGDTQAASEKQVREELLNEKVAEEVRNWYDRAASKSRIILSPLEEPWTGSTR